jgi:NAD(P)-dependent dehydrogenase (short-subunit alcohol dehydrogenase family)
VSKLELDGASVAVTGGARGIGRATAGMLAHDGARVAIGDIDLAAAEQTAHDLANGMVALPVDVSDPGSFAAFVAEAERANGPLDALVANAGLLPLGPFLETDPEVHRRTVDVNLMGPIHALHEVVPRMVERGRGRIVIVASLMGKITVPGAAVYGATKFGVVALAETMRAELRGTGVDVVTVLPAIVRTEASSGIEEGRMIPAVEPEDVADAILHAVRDGGTEISVPRWANPIARAGGALPPTVMRPIRWALRGDRAMKSLDREVRADYEDRLRPGSSA